MRIHTCSFCSHPVYPGHGNMYVRNDGKTFRYCSSKCDKNQRHKKNPRKAKWTKSYRKINGKELTIDPTFEFEKIRNVPVRYNREKMTKALEIIKSVSDIKQKRESKFVMDRLRIGRKHTLKEARQTVLKHHHVVRAAAAGLKYKNKKVNMEDEEENTESCLRNMEMGYKTKELKEDEEVLPKLLSKKKKKTEDIDSNQIKETKSRKKDDRDRIEESMDIDYDEDEEDSDEAEEDSDTDTE